MQMNVTRAVRRGVPLPEKDAAIGARPSDSKESHVASGDPARLVLRHHATIFE